MHIATMEAIPVAYPEPNDFDATRYLCLVKLTADDGTVGWGEAITQFAEANAAGRGVDRRPRRVRRRQGPGPLGSDLAKPQGSGVVVRLQRWAGVERHRGDRHRRVGSQGQGPRAKRVRPARRAGPRTATGDRLVACPLRVHSGDGRGSAGLAGGRTARRQGRVRQARQRPPRLRARSRRRVRAVDARGHRLRQTADHRPRHRRQVGRRHRCQTGAGLRRVRHHVDRRAARRLGPGGLCDATGQDQDADRLRREGVERRGLRARAWRRARAT